MHLFLLQKFQANILVFVIQEFEISIKLFTSEGVMFGLYLFLLHLQISLGNKTNISQQKTVFAHITKKKKHDRNMNSYKDQMEAET